MSRPVAIPASTLAEAVTLAARDLETMTDDQRRQALPALMRDAADLLESGSAASFGRKVTALACGIAALQQAARRWPE